MVNETINIGNYQLECHSINTLIVGSGAASLNAAVSLHSLGQEDILIATEGWGAGTSNNAGSDKQTYYKLSISGNQPDSVEDMARDLFNGRCMHGDIALCEAQGSVRAFMNLVSLGVPFPHDEYGSYPGYRTDHDLRGRATSAGPYTSKMMFSVLAKEVKRRNIRVSDNYHVIALLTSQDRKKVTGAMALNLSEKDPRRAFVLFNSVNIIFGTGGPAGIYKQSVYPASQSGSTGIALKAGATGQNLTESQFGIASVGFRWNLSGSFQQVIPRYFSARSDGSDEKEFLNDYFPDWRTLARAIFLKGYQWPFDPAKIKDWGSSLIDLIVCREIEEKGRKVYIDFRRNPSYGNTGDFSLSLLDPEVYDYLDKSGATQATPFERLCAMNPEAAELYRSHGIDLSMAPVEIAVCVQHNNGGLKADIWWESDLKNLFPVGEVNGSHGVHRPGGSALNSGQVGSYRAAFHIRKKHNAPPPEIKDFISNCMGQVEEELNTASGWLWKGKNENAEKYLEEIRKRMSASAGIIRSAVKVSAALNEASAMTARVRKDIGANDCYDLLKCYMLTDHCLSHQAYLKAAEVYLLSGGRSRGSFIVTGKTDLNNEFKAYSSEMCSYDRQAENEILEIRYEDGEFKSSFTPVRPIPERDLWFERIWAEFRKDNYPES